MTQLSKEEQEKRRKEIDSLFEKLSTSNYFENDLLYALVKDKNTYFAARSLFREGFYEGAKYANQKLEEYKQSNVEIEQERKLRLEIHKEFLQQQKEIERLKKESADYKKARDEVFKQVTDLLNGKERINQEIERVRSLIENAYVEGRNYFSTGITWKQFKTENNL